MGDTLESRNKFIILYIQAVTLDLNAIEVLKSKQSLDKPLILQHQTRLSGRYLSLSEFFAPSCTFLQEELKLTAFSLHPTEEQFKSLNFDLLSSAENWKSESLSSLSSGILADLQTIVNNPRWKPLINKNSGEELCSLCSRLLENGCMAIVENKDLEFVNVDYEKYKHLPSLWDPEDDGVEKGYRPHERKMFKKMLSKLQPPRKSDKSKTPSQPISKTPEKNVKVILTKIKSPPKKIMTGYRRKSVSKRSLSERLSPFAAGGIEPSLKAKVPQHVIACKNLKTYLGAKYSADSYKIKRSIRMGVQFLLPPGVLPTELRVRQFLDPKGENAVKHAEPTTYSPPATVSYFAQYNLNLGAVFSQEELTHKFSWGESSNLDSVCRYRVKQESGQVGADEIFVSNGIQVRVDPEEMREAISQWAVPLQGDMDKLKTMVEDEGEMGEPRTYSEDEENVAKEEKKRLNRKCVKEKTIKKGRTKGFGELVSSIFIFKSTGKDLKNY